MGGVRYDIWSGMVKYIRRRYLINTKTYLLFSDLTFDFQDPAKGGQVTTIEATREITDYFHSKGYNEIDTARVVCSVFFYSNRFLYKV